MHPKNNYQQFVTGRQPFFDRGHQKVEEAFLVGTKKLLATEPFGLQVVEAGLISGNFGKDDLHFWGEETSLHFAFAILQSEKQDLETM